MASHQTESIHKMKSAHRLLSTIAMTAIVFSMQAYAASPSEATIYIADLDAVMKSGAPILKSGTLKAISNHSKRINQLVKTGEKFGSTAFDKPFGYCFSAGIDAQAWWRAQITTAHAEAVPSSVPDSWQHYQSHRTACLEAVAAAGKVPRTEEITSSSDAPPRQGCLKVYGIRSDGQLGVVSYTCPIK